MTEDAEVYVQVPRRGPERVKTLTSMTHLRKNPSLAPRLYLSGRSGGYFQRQFLQVSLGADGCGFLQGKHDEVVCLSWYIQANSLDPTI